MLVRLPPEVLIIRYDNHSVSLSIFVIVVVVCLFACVCVLSGIIIHTNHSLRNTALCIVSTILYYPMLFLQKKQR